MTRFLQSDDRPEGHKLEDILLTLRSDIIKRCDRISMDRRPEAIHVLNNNVQILKLMSEAIELALVATIYIRPKSSTTKPLRSLWSPRYVSDQRARQRSH